MNRQGNNLCSFLEEECDICHVYINPNKEDIGEMWVTMHLMNRGVKELEEAPGYREVSVGYRGEGGWMRVEAE